MQFAVSGGKGSFEPLVLGLEIGNFGFLVLLLGSELFHVARRRCCNSERTFLEVGVL